MLTRSRVPMLPTLETCRRRRLLRASAGTIVRSRSYSSCCIRRIDACRYLRQTRRPAACSRPPAVDDDLLLPTSTCAAVNDRHRPDRAPIRSICSVSSSSSSNINNTVKNLRTYRAHVANCNCLRNYLYRIMKTKNWNAGVNEFVVRAASARSRRTGSMGLAFLAHTLNGINTTVDKEQ